MPRLLERFVLELSGDVAQDLGIVERCAYLVGRLGGDLRQALIRDSMKPDERLLRQFRAAWVGHEVLVEVTVSKGNEQLGGSPDTGASELRQLS